MANNTIKTATMFFDNVTDLDCAVLSGQDILGRSYRVQAEVTGPVETEEQVVIDFSACKKEMKRLIDDVEVGFDHKFIACTADDVDGAFAKKPNGEERSYISTDSFSAIGDPAMFQLIESGANKGIETSLRIAIEELLSVGLAKLVDLDIGKIDVAVTLVPCLSITAGQFRLPFNYVHGLKNSTSFGCQNIIHGHSSFIEAFDTNGFPVSLTKLIELFDIPFDANYIVTTKDNLVDSDDGTTRIEYVSKSRGTFKLETTQDTWVLDYPDTTVENLATHIAIRSLSSLRAAGIAKIRVSEGLSKGAVVDLTVL